MSHTYAVHLVITADSDAEAKALGDTIVTTVERAEIKVLAHDTTDADDWAEHVTLACPNCLQPANRERVGCGVRMHHGPCTEAYFRKQGIERTPPVYPIVDTHDPDVLTNP